jgi:hypothetical protein
MPNQDSYEVDSKQLETFENLARSKYKQLFRVLNNFAKSEQRKKEDYGNELTDLVERYAGLFTTVVEAVSSKFGDNSWIGILPNKNEFLMAYSQNIAAKVVLKDLESLLEGSQSSNSQNLREDKTFDSKCATWGETSYTSIRVALEGMINHCSDSKNYVESIRDFFTGFANTTDSLLKSKVRKEVYDGVKVIKWKIGPYDIDGLKKVVLPTNGGSKKSVNKREHEQFYTPLQDLIVPKALPRNRIIGDKRLMTELERMVKCLFFYDSSVGRNPMVESQKFEQRILIEGMPGGGKGEVCHYLIGYAEEMNRNLGTNLKVTCFEFESSYVDGSIQKLKSQFRQIGNEDRIFLIFQDELDQILQEKKQGKESSNNDVIKEFQKFLEGQYVNKGNYLIVAASNEYLKLPLAIRQRFYTYHWKGAQTKEQKATLFGYKLEDGVEQGYVHVSPQEFQQLGELADKIGLSGRDITRICRMVKSEAFIWDRLGEVYKLRGDYDAQMKKIAEINNPADFEQIKRRMSRFAKDRGNAEDDSMRYGGSVVA